MVDASSFLLKEVLDILNNKRQVGIIFIDLRKAFGSMDNLHMMEKLRMDSIVNRC